MYNQISCMIEVRLSSLPNVLVFIFPTSSLNVFCKHRRSINVFGRSSLIILAPNVFSPNVLPRSGPLECSSSDDVVSVPRQDKLGKLVLKSSAPANKSEERKIWLHAGVLYDNTGRDLSRFGLVRGCRVVPLLPEQRRGTDCE